MRDAPSCLKIPLGEDTEGRIRYIAGVLDRLCDVSIDHMPIDDGQGRRGPKLRSDAWRTSNQTRLPLIQSHERRVRKCHQGCHFCWRHGEITWCRPCNRLQAGEFYCRRTALRRVARQHRQPLTAGLPKSSETQGNIRPRRRIEGRSVAWPIFGMIKLVVMFKFLSQRATIFIAKQTTEDLIVLQGLPESGKIKSVIDRRYVMKDAPDVFRYLQLGHARGKKMITP